jgi:adenine-specific DNA-methyltransferase
MAQIENLVAQIPDPELSAAIAREVKALKERKQFGLVFERHLPETVLIAAEAKIRVGSKARRRTAPEGPDLVVLRTTTATVVLATEDGEVELPRKDVLTVQPFEEPVYPTLREVCSVTKNPDRPHHAVINGENFHALQLLVHAFEGQVDCIYIDPPYNSGASTWKYNNKFVDENDSWLHSKWLSFMEKRLRIAKRLLRPDGVLVVTIDENEVHHLGLLLEEMFPEYLRYMITIVINPKGTNKANFGRTDEQAFFVVPKTGGDVIAQPAPPADEPGWEGDDEEEEEDLAEDEGDRPIDEAEGIGDPAPGFSVLHLRRRGAESSARKDRKGQFYAIYVDEAARKVVGIGPRLELEDPYEVTRLDGVLSIYPIDSEGNERVWRYGRDTMQRLIDAEEIRVGKYNSGRDTYTLNHWKPLEGPRVQRPRTVWWRKAHDAGTHGSTLITRLLGRRNPFPFPKSLYAVRDTLELVVKDRPDALIVDFFAGSGTTMHATCLLNAEDGGRRRSIMVTNNEVSDEDAKALAVAGHFPGDPAYEAKGIFESATMPRCLAAVTGQRPNGTPMPQGRSYKYAGGRAFADGFEENVTFLNLDYLNPDRIELGDALTDMLPVWWFAAGGWGTPPEGLTDDGGSIVDEERALAVLLDEKGLRGFEQALSVAKGISNVFVVSDSEPVWIEVTSRAGIDSRSGQLRRVVVVPRDYLALCRKIARSFR